MSFSERAKLTALAIVKIFETSKPMGDYSAVAVLDDGAGISYGISQFTHRSGSLAAVIERYAKLGGKWHVALASAFSDFQNGRNIRMHSMNSQIKSELARLGDSPLMQQAQREIAFELYLKPALDACEGSDFVLPLSLAVIYDSINHGSYGRIRDRVQFERPGNGSIKPVEFEMEWISEYVRRRDAWLESVPRLKKTDYRTDFFLAQIARGNWQLALPMNVHGYRLTEQDIQVNETFADLGDDEIELDVPVVDKQVARSESYVVGDLVPEIVAPAEPVGTPIREATGFTPEKFQAFIPQIDTAKAWIKRATTGTFLGGVAAFVLGLPEWLQIGLFVLLVAMVVGAIVIFVKYHDRVFEYVRTMNTLRATEGVHDPMVSAETPK